MAGTLNKITSPTLSCGQPGARLSWRGPAPHPRLPFFRGYHGLIATQNNIQCACLVEHTLFLPFFTDPKAGSSRACGVQGDGECAHDAMHSGVVTIAVLILARVAARRLGRCPWAVTGVTMGGTARGEAGQKGAAVPLVWQMEQK
jgi:hypothetical protein